MCLVLQSYPTQDKAQSILEEGKQSGKKGSASRGVEQRRQGKKKEKKSRSSCNKFGHMKADCPEGKKEKHINHKKEFHKKKNKAMVARWSDDESSDCNEESSSSEGNEICFMAGNSEEQVYTTLVIDSVDTPIDGVDTRVKYVDTVPGSFDTRPSLQKTQLPDRDSVSTQPVAMSTLDLVSRRPSCLTGTMCRHSQWQCRH
ncbi:hypothetical protein Taro_032245 [Colocasia esculenta]|uniref:CCHC-type domain-containing protein n=1 Tax=Colocasia esculenta TaxID=4460 RepID=A0A843VQW4_COLES|nr:hypothetical protein [Colocasia esculenta]